MQNFGLPSNIYNGGAVLFNSTPATQFYLQSMAKKRAKDEALDNYFRNYLSSVNPNGLRPQDINGWYDRFNQLKDFYNRNAQAIKNPALDRGNAFGQYLGMAKNMEGYAQTSKGAGALSSQYVAPIVTNPDKSTRMTDNDFSMIHAHDLPLDDPQHQLLNPSSFQFDAKDFDIAAQKKFYDFGTKGIKMSSTITNTKFDPKTGNKITTFENTYSPDDLKAMGDRFGSLYGTDRTVTKAMDDIIHNDPQAHDKYNPIFKSVYGRDMQDNADFTRAYGLNKVQQENTTQKTGSYQRFTPWDYEATREAYHDYSQSDINNTVDANVDRQVQYAQNLLNSPWSAGLDAADLPVDPATLKSLNVNKLQLTRDGQHIVPVYQESYTDPTTGQTGIKDVQGTPMTIDDYKMAIGKRNVGAKYFEKKGKSQPKQSSSSTTVKKYSVNGKSYTDDDLKKLGYTDDQIQQAIKLGTLKAQ